MANENTPPDLSAQFQEWVTQWERASDELSNRLMGTDEFSRAMNQMQGMQLEFQRVFGEAMARQLATFNMPSRDEILTLSEDVRNLDRRLARIERSLEKLEKNTGGTKPKSGPARTKKPPSAQES